MRGHKLCTSCTMFMWPSLASRCPRLSGLILSLGFYVMKQGWLVGAISIYRAKKVKSKKLNICDTRSPPKLPSVENVWFLRVCNIPIDGEEYKWMYESSYTWTAEKVMKTWHNTDNLHVTGLLILRNDAILHNRPQIVSGRTIHEKSHNSCKTAQFWQNKLSFNALSGKNGIYTSFPRWSGDVMKRPGQKNFNAVSHNHVRS